MPTADLLDFATLTAEIPGPNPAGDPKDFHTVRRILDDNRSEHDPSQFPEGTPEHEMPKRDPNWTRIIADTKDHLATKCKHVLYAVRLCEALVMQYGFAGVRDGMKLVRLLFTDAWDRLHPAIEEPGDETARIAQLNWLGDPLKGAFYPTKIRKTPMFGSLSWQNWKDAAGDLESAISATPSERVQQVIDDITAAREELSGLIAIAEQRVPDDIPELDEVSRALAECLNLAQQAQQRKAPFDAGGGEMVTAADGTMMVATGSVQTVNVGASRDQIYDGINRLADALERIEPHSPVPMLLKKIVLLGPMRFHKLVEELTRDQNVLTFMKPEEEKSESGY